MIRITLQKEDTLLHIACETGDEGMATLLIESGIDLDTPNKQGLTALHVAARYGHINLVRHLCLAGCDVDKTNRGIRADVTAIKYGHPDIANLLDKLRNVSCSCNDSLGSSLLLLLLLAFPADRESATALAPTSYRVRLSASS